MTVIACNLREMAADTLVDLDGYPPCHMSKIYRLDDGSVIGGAGASPHLDLVIQWLREGEHRGNTPDFVGESGVDFTILRLRQDGIWLYADCVVPYRIHEKAFAIGAGGQVALHALRAMKMSPAAAAREACKILPTCCGLPVEVMRLNKPKRGRK